jgi:integrase
MDPDAARKEAREIAVKHSRGISVNDLKRTARARGATLGDAFKDYLDTHDLRPNTAATYQFDVNRLKEWTNKPLRDISRDMVQAKYKKICTDTGTAAANKTMRVFRAIYNFAGEQAEGNIPANPVRLKGFWRDVGKRRKTIIKNSDLPAWYRAVNECDNPIVSDLLSLLLYTGLRIKEEALKMDWRDVDMDARTFTITEEKAKGKRENKRYMSRQVHAIFQRRLDNRENGYVFPGASGKDRLGYPARQMATITEKTGIEFCPHDLRRTFATIANDTVPQSQLKYLLGHSTKGGDVTAGYIILSAEKKMDAEQKMGDAIDRLLTPPAEGNVIPIGTKKARKGAGA